MEKFLEEIKAMLEQATEIQGLWKPQNGDTFIQDDTFHTIGDCAFLFRRKSSEKVLEAVYEGIPILAMNLCEEEKVFISPEWIDAKRIWFPSIEQLQNITDIKKLELNFFYEDNMYFCRIKSDTHRVNDEYFSSPLTEILWLKMIMYIQYKKYWNERVMKWQKNLPEEL